MNNSNDDQQKVSEELFNLVLQRVYTKIAPSLTEEDMTKIEQLNRDDQTGNAARYFLLSKVPNFDKLFQEEADQLKTELNPAS